LEKTSRWRWGVNRWIVLALIIGSIFAAGWYWPVSPHIALPAEKLSHHPLFTLPVIGDIYLTNTIVAVLIADVILILLAFVINRTYKKGAMVPGGITGAVEALLEALYNMTESTAGKWAKTIFPYFATITMLVLVVNWMELIPGVDSIGIIEEAPEGAHGFVVEEAEINGIGLGVDTITDEEAHHGEESFLLVPFVRVTSTDLNFTLALAITSVVMTQVIGFRALGGSYLTKFFTTKTLFKVPMFGVIDFAVGFLELISEFSKILSFTFRLFGNIFAGSVLLFVIGSLVPVFAQSGFLMLEFFVGLIQALVFGLLTMTFMSLATQSHEHAEEH
jgi:F-type H+-transporting ATPase subunit a